MIDFNDIGFKSIPELLRGVRHVDIIKAWHKPNRDIQNTANITIAEIDERTIFDGTINYLRHRLNDLFDPLFRKIVFVHDNAANSDTGFRLLIPNYIAFGNFEERIRAIVDFYLILGVKYVVTEYATGITTLAETYLDNLIAADPVSNSEIIEVLNLFHTLEGAGLLTNTKRLHLYSQSSAANALKDFLVPATTLTEVGGAGTFSDKGRGSDGSMWYSTGFTPSADITDIANWTTFLHLSEHNGADFPSVMDYGSSHTTLPNDTSRFSSVWNITPFDTQTFRWFNRQVNVPRTAFSQHLGTYAIYGIAGLHSVTQDNVLLAPEQVVGSATLPDREVFINSSNDGGTVFKTKQKFGTWAEYDAQLSYADLSTYSNAIQTYNNNLGR